MWMLNGGLPPDHRTVIPRHWVTGVEKLKLTMGFGTDSCACIATTLVAMPARATTADRSEATILGCVAE